MKKVLLVYGPSPITTASDTEIIPTISCSSSIFQANAIHLSYGTSATDIIPIVAPRVGRNMFENPSPYWYASTITCLGIPIISPLVLLLVLLLMLVRFLMV